MAGLTNYIAFVDPETGLDRIGHLDIEQDTIQPLSFHSGTPVKNLYQVIEVGSRNVITNAGSAIPVSSVKILPPLSGRDVLAVGKNYTEHAKEFNSSGYDSSDKVDLPSHPVIFTKRATSIIAHGEEIQLHEDFTSTADYEGEIGVIIGKAGLRIEQEKAWEYVWGYTIINDMTAREKQRDHKQFFLGKSADTYCPMGPIAVPKEALPQTLRVQTHVNGEPRQDATTSDLIFPIPQLLAVISQGQTLQPGDVLATGTPAGVGIGKQPPVFLKAGDEISISVTGLSTLRNRISQRATSNISRFRSSPPSAFELTNSARTAGATNLTDMINGKPMSYQKRGSGSDENMIFVHGLGGTKEYWTPLISTLSLSDLANLHLYDLEGHGLSPTHPLSQITIDSLAVDLSAISRVAGIWPSRPATFFAHSMGCLIALKFTLDNPGLVKRLILLGPPPLAIPKTMRNIFHSRAAQVRKKGMSGIVDDVISRGFSLSSLAHDPIGVAAARLSLIGQDPEGYAKGCQALADAPNLNVEDLQKLDVSVTLIITGQDDTYSTPAVCQVYKEMIRNSRVETLDNVGHWHIFEDAVGIAAVVKQVLAE